MGIQFKSHRNNFQCIASIISQSLIYFSENLFSFKLICLFLRQWQKRRVLCLFPANKTYLTSPNS